MATVLHTLATEEDLLSAPADGFKRELVDGAIRVSPAGGRHGWIGMLLGARLVAHVRAHGLGYVFDAQTGFRLPGGNVRLPDLAFVATGRVDPQDPGFVPAAPDLAVEVLSPGDRSRDVLDKVGEYLDAGTRLVWVIDPEARRALVYRSISEAFPIEPDGYLDGADVVPGFRCALAEILDQR